MDSKVYFSPIEDSYIIEYMSRSDDPELMSTMGWRPFGPDEKERFFYPGISLHLVYDDSLHDTMHPDSEFLYSLDMFCKSIKSL